MRRGAPISLAAFAAVALIFAGIRLASPAKHATAAAVDKYAFAQRDAGRGPATSNPYEHSPVTHLTPVAHFAPGIFDAPADASARAMGTKAAKRYEPEDLEGMLLLAGKPVLYGANSLRTLDADLQPGPIVHFHTTSQAHTTRAIEAGGPRLRVADGGDENDNVAVFDPASGALVWRQSAPGVRFSADEAGPGPLQTGDVLAYLAGRWQQETLFVRRAATGELLWKRDHVVGLTSNESAIFVVLDGSPSLTIASLDVDSGEARWTTALAALPSWRRVSFSVGGGYVAFVQEQELHAGWNGDHGSIALLDAATGAISWIQDVPGARGGGIDIALKFYGPEMYRIESQAIRRVDPSSGEVLWSADATTFGQLVHGRDAIYVEHAARGADRNGRDGILRALDPTTGRELWSYGMGSVDPFDFLPDLTQILDTDGGELVVVHGQESRDLTVFRRGPVALSPIEKHVTIDVFEGETFEHDSPRKPLEYESQIRIGAQNVQTDAHGHWEGVVSGRGQLSVEIGGWSDLYLEKTAIDLENGEASEALKLTMFPPEFRQACAVDR